MTPIAVIARLTIREAFRRRLILAVFILTGIAIVCSGWGLSRLEGSASRQAAPPVASNFIATLVILLAFMFSVVLEAGAAFLAASAIAADAESGLLFAMLPRPIRRGELLVGKWLGLATLLSLYGFITGGLELFVTQRMAGYLPPHPLLALVYIIGECLVLLALGLLTSTRLAPTTGSILVVALFGVAWVAGIASNLASLAHVPAVETAGNAITMLLPTDGLWRGAVYNLQPTALTLLSRSLGASMPFLVDAPPPLAYILWSVSWTVAILALAVVSFRHRDL